MSGTEAVESGLFSRVLPADEVPHAATGCRRAAATGATQAFLASKTLVQSLRDERLGLWESSTPRTARRPRSATPRLPRGFRGLPGEARADVHRAQLTLRERYVRPDRARERTLGATCTPRNQSSGIAASGARSRPRPHAGTRRIPAVAHPVIERQRELVIRRGTIAPSTTHGRSIIRPMPRIATSG
jgi:hypothetical protein